MLDGGKPQKTYFIGTGLYDRPVMIWWDEENGKWALSSQSQDELEKYYDRITAVHLPNAKLEIKLTA
jgi:hypothetical protein